MNLTAVKFFGDSRAARYVLDRRAHMLLFGDAKKTQTRCKSQKMPKAIEMNRYQKSEEPIGIYGFCLLASNITNILFIIYMLYNLL